ncbi:hypothetical protein O7627_12930 [Solwaraspora sp. WMMD1047]|uniref:hypothetical protein n=1 Tax=Solwaraspora sp. WMMD1047 TaxID=3016102 RepID=UPI0024174578|nr:hypothetical protein [Solwaraspora sp. WMMD1047]MDG4830202.1 hypothetical protein [Solwaraspora sp. WMMD1047]
MAAAARRRRVGHQRLLHCDQPGEQWTPETLAAAYRTAYHGFLDRLRAWYGPGTTIVVSATDVAGTPALVDAARQIVAERADRGDRRIHYWYYPGSELDYGGCHWHPSSRDHELIADRLAGFLVGLPPHW